MKRKLLLITIIIAFWGCSNAEDEPIVIKTEPTIITSAITDISQTNATSGGSITSDGESIVIQKGICWSKSSNPTIIKTISSGLSLDGEGNETFTSELKELQQNTTYYVRAYATNNIGTSYGNEISFTTLDDDQFLGCNIPELVYEGDIIFYSQEEIDNFGNQGYTKINGSVLIIGNETILDYFPNNGLDPTLMIDDINNLEGLSCVSEIGGYLSIIGPSNLNNLNGLENLTKIANGLDIYYNEALKNLSGLNNLTSIGRLIIYGNPILESINELNNLTNIVGGLTIWGNSSLINLKGFDKLTKVNFLTIYNNPSLTDLSGLENLKIVETNLKIQFNNSLENIEALKNLTSVGTRIDIQFNETLKNLYGLNGIEALGHLKIAHNPTLKNLIGLDNLTKVGGTLSIGFNDNLESLNGLENLNFIGGYDNFGTGNLEIGYNAALTNFCVIKDVQFLGSNYYYNVVNNAYNPTEEQLKSANECSQ